MEKIKIIAIVREPGGTDCYVLNRDIKYTYTKIDRETIIGEDEGVLNFYKYVYFVHQFLLKFLYDIHLRHLLQI